MNLITLLFAVFIVNLTFCDAVDLKEGKLIAASVVSYFKIHIVLKLVFL